MIKLNRTRCTECRICMLVCSLTHFEENTTKRSRIMVDAKWPDMPSIKVCLACRDHECVAACPHDALRWQNWIELDPDRCDGCGACADACPVEGVQMDSTTGLPLICDTCEGRFQCVQWCPTQAVQKKD